MKKQHKYFRNLSHKAKLESKAHNHRTYWSHTEFYTKDPDPRDIREHSRMIYYRAERLGSVDAALKEYVEADKKFGGGKFVYFTRPEVNYSIHKVHTNPSYSKRRKELCKRANRFIRQRWKQYGEIYQRGQCKKAFEVKWDLD